MKWMLIIVVTSVDLTVRSISKKLRGRLATQSAAPSNVIDFVEAMRSRDNGSKSKEKGA